MASFTLITQSMTVGYNEHGFFACGTTDNFVWNDRGEYVHGEQLPNLRGQLIYWRVDSDPTSQWDKYRAALHPDDVSKREPILNEFWASYGDPCARMERSRFFEEGEATTNVQFSLPSDPSLTTFIMAAAMADRELAIHSYGWGFLSDDKLAPAVSHAGWMERFEPAFSIQRPILRLR